MTEYNVITDLERVVRAFQGMAEQDPNLVRKHQERLVELANEIINLTNQELK